MAGDNDNDDDCVSEGDYDNRIVCNEIHYWHQQFYASNLGLSTGNDNQYEYNNSANTHAQRKLYYT